MNTMEKLRSLVTRKIAANCWLFHQYYWEEKLHLGKRRHDRVPRYFQIAICRKCNKRKIQWFSEGAQVQNGEKPNIIKFTVPAGHA